MLEVYRWMQVGRSPNREFPMSLPDDAPAGPHNQPETTAWPSALLLTGANSTTSTDAVTAAVDPQTLGPDTSEPMDQPSLKIRAIRGSAWTISGYGTGQVLRLGSNILMSYLLVPEDFGLMALVSIFLQALQMFSDIGIGPSIIQNQRGEEPAFLNTAWTIQVCRGIALWLIACVIAWPVSLVWGASLAYLLPVAALTTVIQGFNSTRLFALNRDLRIGRLTQLTLFTQIIAIITMIGWAWFLSPTVWALIAGGIAGSFARMVLSHTVIPGHSNRFHWDRSAFGELIRFGRWLFFSTIITFLAGQIDKLIYGGFMSAAALGVFWIGFQLAQILPSLAKQIGGIVGFPAMSELYRRDEHRFRQRLLHLRISLVVPINLGLLVLVCCGTVFVYFVIPTRYLGAGWIIQVLAINSMAGMLNTSYGHAFMAAGATLRNLVTTVGQMIAILGATLIGYYLDGERGFIMGIGISQWLKYPLDAYLAARSGFWQPKFDLPVLIVSAILSVAALMGSSLLMEAVIS